LIKFLVEKINDKKILIMGYGAEGKAVLKRLLEADTAQQIDVFDKICPQLPEKVNYVEAPDFEAYDLIVKSPGIVLGDEFPFGKLTSMTQLFLEFYKNQTIGITGTKGKSTTASMLYHVLKENNVNAVLVGNIGVPAFDMLEEIDKETTIVFEMSSHQLEYVKTSPNIAIYLNIYEEHLDHYGTFEKYQKAKENIYRFMTKEDMLICKKELVPQNVNFKIAEIEPDIIQVPKEKLKIKGEHNLYNISAIYPICKNKGISDKDFINSVCSFKGLAHRLEYAGCYDGIEFYDDSISTICQTAIEALKSLPETDTVILGGMDRGIDYTQLVEFLKESSVRNILLMYDTGKRIEKILNDSRAVYVGDLESAVKRAKEVTKKGGVCLLSPAAASYGFFKSFEHRGDTFKELIKK